MIFQPIIRKSCKKENIKLSKAVDNSFKSLNIKIEGYEWIASGLLVLWNLIVL